MITLTDVSGPIRSSDCAWLKRIGVLGTVLALVILAASMMLRLWTTFDADGRSTSALLPSIENMARLAHRLSATAVAILALCAMALYWINRRTARHLAKPIACVALFTAVLAVIGPLTSGYRFAWITVLNVTTGMLLLIAFWWLRTRASVADATPRATSRLSWLALVAFVVHVASGAATSAWDMSGVRWLAFLHLGSLFPAVILIGLIVMDRRGKRAADRIIRALLGLLAIQGTIGYMLMQMDARPRGVMLLHGLLSPALALTLVSLMLSHSADQKDRNT